MALHHLVARRSWGPSGSHPWLLGGSEDPWLCVPDFGQVCLLSDVTKFYALIGKSRQFGVVPKSGVGLSSEKRNVRIGSLADLLSDITLMSAFERIADTKERYFRSPWLNVRFHR
jgi:hypothetical protein